MLSRYIVALSVLPLALAGCAANYSPNTYAAAAVQQASKVDRGVIVGRRLVQVSAQGTVGAVAGGAAGGIAGSQAPGGSVASAFGALGGTLVGGLVGTAAEHAVADTQAWQYIVQQPNGDLLTQADQAPLAVGLHVLVIAGKQARIVPDYTAALGAAGGRTRRNGGQGAEGGPRAAAGGTDHRYASAGARGACSDATARCGERG